MAITVVTWPTCGTPKQGTSGRRGTSFPSPCTPQNPSRRGRMTRATPSSKSVQQRTNTLSGPRGELEAGDEILYAAWFFDLTDQEQVQGEQTDGDVPDGGHTGAHDHRTTNPEGRQEEIPYAARFFDTSGQAQGPSKWAEEAWPNSRCVTPRNNTSSDAKDRGRKQDPEQDSDLLAQRAQTPPRQHPISEDDNDHEDQDPRQPTNLQDLTDHGNPLDLTDPPDLGDPDENEEECREQDPEGTADPDPPTHNFVVLDPDADKVDQLLPAAAPAPPLLDQGPEPPQRRGRTGGRRLFNGMVTGMLGLISLAATAEAYALVIPNGTATRPGEPEPAMPGLGGLTCYSTGWEDVTRAVWGLLLLLIPVVAKLITRVQQLEDALGQKPVLAEQAQATAPASEPRSAPDTGLAELIARVQQLGEALTRRPVSDDRHSQTCPLTAPTMTFFQAKWCKVVPGTPPIGYLDPNNYLGYELSAHLHTQEWLAQSN